MTQREGGQFVMQISAIRLQGLHELCVTVAAAAPTSAVCVDKWAKSVGQTMTNFPRLYLCLKSPSTPPILSQSL